MANPTNHLRSRKITLRVLNLSMSKTGTSSMKAALEVLGYPTYHGFVMMEQPADHPRWEKAINAKYLGKGKTFSKAEFDDLLGDYAAASDVPCIGFGEELLLMYPDAKVILVERDVDAWFRSWSIIIKQDHTFLTWLLRNVLEPITGSRPATNMRNLHYAMFQCTNEAEQTENAKRVYREYYAHVRAIVPESRRLEYKLGSGWEPLCTFLGERVPDTEFPRLNESKEFEKMIKRIIDEEVAKSLRFVGTYGLPAAFVLLALWLFYR